MILQLDHSLYNTISESMITDMYTGMLKKGEKLPAIEALCVQYGVGHNTMRASLRLLDERGFIRMEQGDAPVVVFDFNDSVQRERYIVSLLSRRESINDVFFCLEVLMPDIISFCLRQSGGETLRGYRRTLDSFFCMPAQEDKDGRTESVLKFYRVILSHVHNSVLTDIVEQMIRFVLVPISSAYRMGEAYQYQKKKTFSVITACLHAALRQDENETREMVRLLCQLYATQSEAYLCKLTAFRPATRLTPFTWQPVREQEYLYAQLVVVLLRAIHSGVYRPWDRLPAYEQMSKQFDVSQRTARRAVAVLNQLHILSADQGLGSVVQPPQMYDSQIITRDQLVWNKLLHFFEAVQVLALTCRPVVRTAIANISLEDVKKIEAAMNEDEHFPIEPLIGMIFARTGSPTLMTIYQQLRYLMVWGFCIDLIWRQPDVRSRIRELGKHALYTLKAGEMIAAEEAMSQLYRTIYESEAQFARRMRLDVPPFRL